MTLKPAWYTCRHFIMMSAFFFIFHDFDSTSPAGRNRCLVAESDGGDEVASLTCYVIIRCVQNKKHAALLDCSVGNSDLGQLLSYILSPSFPENRIICLYPLMPFFCWKQRFCDFLKYYYWNIKIKLITDTIKKF